MRLNDFALSDVALEGFGKINYQCSQFLTQSRDVPLYKNLPRTYDDIRRVKIRKRKHNDSNFDEAFNQAFENEAFDLRQRAMFANGISSLLDEGEHVEPFFVFPIDGFQYIYCPEVRNSSNSYKQTIGMMYEQFGDEQGSEVAQDLLRFTYKKDKLREGIVSGAEIIVFSIPFYYIVRCDICESYDDLLHVLRTI